MLVKFCLTVSLYRKSHQTGCVIVGRLIMFITSILELLMMYLLVKVPYLSQALNWIATWYAVHLIAGDCWGHILNIQRCDDTLSWATITLGSTSLLGRLSLPCQESYSWYCLSFTAHNNTCSALLRIFILILNAVYDFLISLAGP